MVGGEEQALGYSFFGKKGLHIGLLMKERGRRLGLVLWSSVYDYTSQTVTGFQARKARNKHY